MSVDDKGTGGFSLRRWSRRKLDAARPALRPETTAEAPAPVDPHPLPPATVAATGSAAGTAAATAANEATAPAAGALPPTETLTFDSDFTAYLQPKVDEAIKRKALRALFRDPRFNVMDGLDVYIDDYSIPDPISAEMVRGLVQSRDIFDPPQTRINAAGHVEDVPADERVPRVAATDADAPAAIAATDSAVMVPALPALPTGADTAPPDGVAPAVASPDDAVSDATALDATAPDAVAPIPPKPVSRSDR